MKDVLKNKELLYILEKREKERFFSHLQKKAESDGAIPPQPSLLLKKIDSLLQYVGGIFIGIFLGVFTLIINFIVFVYILHLEF